MHSDHTAFDHLLQVCAQIIHTTPALQQFARLPDDLVFKPRAAVRKPVADYLPTHLPNVNHDSQAFVDALLAVLPQAEWRTTYTADQVGLDFVNRYGYLELYGPDGHYISQQSRAFIGYWGNHLHYPPHHHPAEELYYIAAGQAAFATQSQPPIQRTAGQSQIHSSNEVHSMDTDQSAVLCFVLWRGAGLADSASLSD